MKHRDFLKLLDNMNKNLNNNKNYTLKQLITYYKFHHLGIDTSNDNGSFMKDEKKQYIFRYNNSSILNREINNNSEFFNDQSFPKEHMKKLKVALSERLKKQLDQTEGTK